MAKKRNVTISKKIKRAARRGDFDISDRGFIQKKIENKVVSKEKKETREILIPQVVPVRVLAELLEVSPTNVVAKLFENGVQATINDSVDFDTAAIIADEFNAIAKKENIKTQKSSSADSKSKLIKKPPVVAVMGHVDHGKTTLLDSIRSTNVASGESGGITQHIGAYQVEVETGSKEQLKSSLSARPPRPTSSQADSPADGETKAGVSNANRGIPSDKKLTSTTRKITFLDTPGHEAFSTMRAHGANITDVVVLVVAADDGVKPQTLEAISHARSAGVPIIVAINKIDSPSANVEKTKRELSEHNLIPEEWGGKTPMVEVSAKKILNINELLEIISLSSDLEDLKTNPKKSGVGVIIESKIKPGLGPVATILVQDGTLHQGANIVIGNQIGKIRTMENDTGAKIKLATASMPILISGFKQIPQVGEQILEVEDEKQAKAIIENNLKSTNVKSAISGLGGVSQAIKKGKLKKLNIVLKADVRGSLEAIKNSLTDIKSDDVAIEFVGASIGEVTESDINLALSSSAIIIAFGVDIPPAVKKFADEVGVKISKYTVIYELIDEIKAALQGLLEPEIVETDVGKFKVLKIFRRTQESGIVGGLVTKGTLRPGLKFRAFRKDESLGEGTVESIQIGPDNVDTVKKDNECGILYKGSFKFKPDDIIEAYQREEILKVIK